MTKFNTFLFQVADTSRERNLSTRLSRSRLTHKYLMYFIRLDFFPIIFFFLLKRQKNNLGELLSGDTFISRTHFDKRSLQLFSENFQFSKMTLSFSSMIRIAMKSGHRSRDSDDIRETVHLKTTDKPTSRIGDTFRPRFGATQGIIEKTISDRLIARHQMSRH